MIARNARVLIVVHHFPPHLSGVGNVAHNQAVELVKRGLKVSVLTSDCSDKSGTMKSKYGYTIHRVRALNFMESKFGAAFPIFSPTLAWQAYKLVKDCDIVHINDSLYISSFISTIWAKLLKKPIILTQHIEMVPHPSSLVLFTQKFIYRTTGKYVLRRSNKVIVLNSRVEKFLTDGGISKQKIVFLPNSVDTEKFAPAKKPERQRLREKYNLPQNKTLALFVGRFLPKKGYTKLMKVNGIKDFAIVFVGGEQPSTYTNEGHYFLGIIDRSKMDEVYKMCDVFILPSTIEGFPVSIQEAMSSGLPIITNDDHGYDIYNLDRNFVELIQPTITNIKFTIMKVLNNDTYKNKMSSYSRHYAQENFATENVSKNILKLYKSVI